MCLSTEQLFCCFLLVLILSKFQHKYLFTFDVPKKCLVQNVVADSIAVYFDMNSNILDMKKYCYCLLRHEQQHFCWT